MAPPDLDPLSAFFAPFVHLANAGRTFNDNNNNNNQQRPPPPPPDFPFGGGPFGSYHPPPPPPPPGWATRGDEWSPRHHRGGGRGGYGRDDWRHGGGGGPGHFRDWSLHSGSGGPGGHGHDHEQRFGTRGGRGQGRHSWGGRHPEHFSWGGHDHHTDDDDRTAVGATAAGGKDAPDPEEVAPGDDSDKDTDLPPHMRGGGGGRAGRYGGGRGGRRHGGGGGGGGAHAAHHHPHHHRGGPGPGHGPGNAYSLIDTHAHGGPHGGPHGSHHYPPPPPPPPPAAAAAGAGAGLELSSLDMGTLLRTLGSHPVLQQFIGQYMNPGGDAREVSGSGSGSGGLTPPVDIFDTPDAVILHFSLPGTRKNAVDVVWDPDARQVRIVGEVRRPGDEDLVASLQGIGERQVGPFDRRVQLPGTEALDGDAITARMEDGVLMITVPKVEKPWCELRRIDVE
ncbi:HSP20 family protein [Geosmithia morbida]|uniref:HSP20 family protein n=1 Tax=Geosmithia morbida TaxID=1094350 RepID=A0A9P4YYD0_9HYPO|nr:HSP20 family protein [Geosmithia morbida]KAF4123943.1 HSP20 family protein [Geosmithia morbida]